ncbi:MAG: hypothetical protein V7723_02535 [Sneathiella sp.]|uniref:alpha/beta hydrolase n=1 Tax=Sneathiella sp. TaxID=1964365 RepID=UPI0030033D90
MNIKNGLISIGVIISLAIIAGYFAMQYLFGHIHHFGNTAGSPEKFGLTNIEVVQLISEDGEKITAWIKPPSDEAPVIFGFLGNGSSIGPSVRSFKPYLDKGYGLAALAYRGSSGVGGDPSELAIGADARVLYDQLDSLLSKPIPANQRVAYGYSFGTGVAVTLAAEREFSGVILVAAYSRLCDVITAEFKGIPMCLIMYRERYDSMRQIAKINAPLLMLHGEQDKSIDISFGKLLFETAIQPKQFISYENGTHLNLQSMGIKDDIMSFFNSIADADNSNR